jgi:hypothetical protein
MTNMNKKFSQDEELSEFTDRVLKGTMKHTASDSDEEMHSLEETILRLHNSMPASSLEESKKKQMLVRLNARIRREKEIPQQSSFWNSLFNLESIRSSSRVQFAGAIGVIALIITAVVFSPGLIESGGATTIGTALSGSNGFILPAVLLGLIVLILWLKRRK